MPGALPKRLFTLALAAALAGSLGVSPAKAGGIFEIIHPDVEEGKAEFEFLTTVLLTDIAPGAERSIHELAFGFGVTERIGSYLEWYALFPSDAETANPEHYLNGGFTFLVNNDVQLDICLYCNYLIPNYKKSFIG